MELEDVYPMFKACYERVDTLDQEKSFGLMPLAKLKFAIQLYAEILGACNQANKEAPMSIMDLVNWPTKQ